MASSKDPADGLDHRLVRAGAELLRSDGVAALSLREIARRAGVSHGAPRRHFPTHVALLSAIARTGFADLTAQVEATGGGLPELARVYVRFGLLESNELGLREASLPLFRLLTDLMPGRSAVEAGALWANLHGIVQLWNWNAMPLATGATDVDELVTAALKAYLP